MMREPYKTLSAVTANGNGTVLNLPKICSTFAMQVTHTGTPTGGTITLEGSLDGASFVSLGAVFTIGTDASGVIKFVTDKPVHKIRTPLAALSGGSSPTVTCHVTAAD